jgi:ketosteroid isomerase-like protein
LGKLFRKLSISKKAVKPKKDLVNMCLAALASQAIEEQQHLAACEISVMTIGYQNNITGKVVYKHHP